MPQHAIPRQLQSSTAVPAEHAAKAAANTQQTQQVHLKDFKPLLRQLFEEESSQTQSAEQLQSKIDQLQALQQILQVQQRGLKQQQQALQRPPAARTACALRGSIPLLLASSVGPWEVWCARLPGPQWRRAALEAKPGPAGPGRPRAVICRACEARRRFLL